MPKTTKTVRLEHTTQGHNKFYEIWIEKDIAYQVMFQYGKIGTNGVGGLKSKHNTEMAAQMALNKLKASKLAKGYKEVPWKEVYQPNVPDSYDFSDAGWKVKKGPSKKKSKKGKVVKSKAAKKKKQPKPKKPGRSILL